MSWITSSAKPTPTTAVQPPVRTQPVAPPPMAPAPSRYSLPPAANMAAMTIEDTSDGWGDEDHDVFDDMASVPRVKTEVSPAAKKNILFTAPPEEDDFFGGFDAKPAKAATMMKTTGRLALPSKKQSTSKPVAAPAVKKLAVDDMEDIWDDF
jgi:hypothetical protein